MTTRSAVAGNVVLGNQPDLFWDGSGTGNVFHRNRCRTSDPHRPLRRLNRRRAGRGPRPRSHRRPLVVDAVTGTKRRLGRNLVPEALSRDGRTVRAQTGGPTPPP